MSLVKFIEAGGLLGLQGKELLSWAENELAKEKEQKNRDDERRHERELEIIEKKNRRRKLKSARSLMYLGTNSLFLMKKLMILTSFFRFLNAKPNC